MAWISVGSLSPTINWKTLAKQDFALPTFDEQRRILRILKAFENDRTSRELALTSMSRLETTALERAFPSSTASNRSAKKIRLNELCVRITDGTHQPPETTDSGIPFITIGNFRDRTIDWTDTKWVSEQTYSELTKRFRPTAGDILYAVVGHTLGQAIFIDWDFPFVFQRHIGVLRVDPEKALPKYVYYYLRSPLSVLQDRMRAEGGAQKTIALKSLGAYELPERSLDEQARIVDSLDQLGESRKAQLNRIEQLTRVRAMVTKGAWT
jgi:type I restriction enzyme S subunit